MWQTTKMMTMPESRVDMVVSRLWDLLEDLDMRLTWWRRALDTARKISQLRMARSSMGSNPITETWSGGALQSRTVV